MCTIYTAIRNFRGKKKLHNRNTIEIPKTLENLQTETKAKY